jgi:hypothetical protein
VKRALAGFEIAIGQKAVNPRQQAIEGLIEIFANLHRARIAKT